MKRIPAVLGLLLMPALLPAQALWFRVRTGPAAQLVPAAGTAAVTAPGLGKSSAFQIGVTYQGSLTAVITRAELAGSNSFSITRPPELPRTLRAEEEAVWELSYAPSQPGRVDAQFAVAVRESAADGTVLGQAVAVINLAGTTPSLTAAWLTPEENFVRLASGETLPFPPTPLGSVSGIPVVITNRGSAPGTVQSVSVEGQFFQTGQLTLLPVAVEPGGELRFVVRYAPLEAGRHAGTLRMRLADGEINAGLTGSATGSGSQLAYRYEQETGMVSARPGDRIFLPPVPLGATERRRFSIENTGSPAAVIPGIQLANGQSGLQLEDLPPLPLTLQGGESASFTLRSTPPAVGPFSDVLLIGAAAFDILAAGGRPPALPSYTLTASETSGEPAQQPSLSLQLATSYPLPIRGLLSMRAVSNGYGTDPKAVFADGGRTVPFRIPADTTDAIFGDGSRNAFFQTGTVSETLVFEPTFVTTADVDITPDAPGTLTLIIPPGPPRLASARVSEANATAVEVVVNGYVTTRSLTLLELRFSTGASDGVDRLIDLTAVSNAWFGSPQSDAYGGMFSLTIPFKAPAGAARLNTITVTVRNSFGGSNTVAAKAP